jgi:hypothetical protein
LSCRDALSTIAQGAPSAKGKLSADAHGRKADEVDAAGACLRVLAAQNKAHLALGFSGL